jgi:radical SAM protein with 4Fe4S-binding SPASM domain
MTRGFPRLKEGSIITLNPDNIVAYVPCEQGEGKRKWSTYISKKLNMEAFRIIKFFNGKRKVKDIIEEYSKTYNKDLKVEILKKFIEDAHSNKIIELSQTPSDTHFEVRGSLDHFFPNHMIIELTYSCNFRCKHCYVEAEPGRKEFIDFDSLIKWLEEYKNKGGVLVELTGGECILHKDFFKILDYCAKNFLLIAITTNGSLLTEEKINLLESYKDKIVISVSLDSYNESFFNKFRVTKDGYKKVINALKILGERKFFYRVSMVVYDENFDDIEPTLLLAEKLGASNFSFSPVFEAGRSKILSNINKVAEAFIKMKEKYGDFVFAVSENQIKQYTKNKNCGSGYKSVTLSPDGELRTCIMFNNLWSLGNLNKKTFNEIFENGIGNLFYKLESPSDETCGNCKYILECGGCISRGIYYSNKVEKCRWKEKYCDIIDKITIKERK